MQMHVAHLHACAAQTAHRCASCAHASAERKHLHQSQQGGGEGEGRTLHNIIVRSIVTQLAFVHQIVKSDRLIARLHASRPLMILFFIAYVMFVLVCGGGGDSGGGGDVLPGDHKQEVTVLRRLPTPRCPGAGLLAQVFVFGVDGVLQSG